MITASYKKHILNFKQPSGTSRGVLKTKETWFLILNSEERKGIGECGLFRGLSVDDTLDYEDKLKWLCKNINNDFDYLLGELIEYPSIQFGLEMALKSLESSSLFDLFPSAFTQSNASININGLIWMGNEVFMKQQIEDKIKAGFNCIKMKIGAIDFQTETYLLKSIRNDFSSKDIELRVDANGAFTPSEALEKLKILSEFDLHSIEQPIKQGQIEAMSDLCSKTPLPIALDEELIGVFGVTKKQELLQTINPQYIILKPSLIGGFKGSDAWIEMAERQNIGWWITSALESNIGLNAIAQYTFLKQSSLPQGLGTGSLFTNNFDSPLQVLNGALYYNNKKQWHINL
ncbi:o-succinylbenzoate synthase [Pseudalgibacter alginicilyticus]|uniref:O-succinylbenzoate synthase n=1 Tax=Pseudalgibacter alginicilyticus TaxID=1736674 RepID=A0A0P0D7F1_9FLAO|nr:o-succinylbenzoate synthase [Pseudalgibacter alginicilyticus]ALJ03660.1 o-succinylbenzoate synthase [Pseudalgibacter alginicilyticus]